MVCMRSEGAMEPPSQAQILVAMSQALLAQAMVVQSQFEKARACTQCLMAVSRQLRIRARQIIDQCRAARGKGQIMRKAFGAESLNLY
jgi:hypothetical protein